MTDKMVEIKVEGMTCGHCASRVENALENAHGVKEANVDLEGKKATIQFDDERTSVEELKKAINDLGYSAI